MLTYRCEKTTAAVLSLFLMNLRRYIIHDLIEWTRTKRNRREFRNARFRLINKEKKQTNEQTKSRRFVYGCSKYFQDWRMKKALAFPTLARTTTTLFAKRRKWGNTTAAAAARSGDPWTRSENNEKYPTSYELGKRFIRRTVSRKSNSKIHVYT